MADNYTQVTVVPSLPRAAFIGNELKRLQQFGLDHEDAENGEVYLFSEFGINDEPCDYHDADDEQPSDGDEDKRDAYDILCDVLRRLPEDLVPEIFLEGAQTCSKLRPGEFGGIATRITRTSITHGSTQLLLEEFRTAETLVPAIVQVLALAEEGVLDLSQCDGDEMLLAQREEQVACIERVQSWLRAQHGHLIP